MIDHRVVGAARAILPALRVLIVKRDKLGDLLLTTPVLRHLAEMRPDAEVHLLANDYNAWVARGHAAIARVWTYPRVRDGRRLRPFAALAQIPIGLALRRQHFDAAIVMGGDESPRAIRRTLLVGASRVVAYAHDPARYGRRLTDALPVPAAGHEVDRMMALLTPLGIAAPDRASHPEYALPQGDAAFARAWLRERGLDASRYVVLGLGARKAKKQPSTAQILRWSERLWRERGLSTVFMWTPGARDADRYPGDDDIAAPVLAEALPYVHPFRGPIPHALGLMFHARTSIVPDSGLMHFAAASPGGVLGLFADPADSAPAARWAPRGARATWLEADKRVSDLTDAVVFEALEPLLGPRAERLTGSGDGAPVAAVMPRPGDGQPD
jgi:ADP-heptose:LPS heptosyltransferase